MANIDEHIRATLTLALRSGRPLAESLKAAVHESMQSPSNLEVASAWRSLLNDVAGEVETASCDQSVGVTSIETDPTQASHRTVSSDPSLSQPSKVDCIAPACTYFYDDRAPCYLKSADHSINPVPLAFGVLVSTGRGQDLYLTIIPEVTTTDGEIMTNVSITTSCLYLPPMPWKVVKFPNGTRNVLCNATWSPEDKGLQDSCWAPGGAEDLKSRGTGAPQ